MEDVVGDVLASSSVLSQLAWARISASAAWQPAAGNSVVAADMVEMGVACDGIERPFGDERHPFA
ncbi:MAG: hypothetical protein R3D61_11445 [Defluviimonas denitrificans]